MSRAAQERFWEKVNKDGPIPAHRPDLGQCWVWTRSTDGGGYGKFSVSRSKWQRAHRVSWTSENGDPGDLWVLHHCDNPLCVRPDHLFLGTPKDNTQDMISKGRKVNVIRLGEENPNAKLTPQAAEEIRARFAGGEGRKALAEAFGVSESRVSGVLGGRAWADAGGPVRERNSIGRPREGDHSGETHECACCGRKRKHKGRGLCGACYQGHYVAGTLNRHPINRKGAAA